MRSGVSLRASKPIVTTAKLASPSASWALVDRLVEGLDDHRAGSRAGGVDQVDHQRLAAEVGEPHRLAEAVAKAKAIEPVADRRLADPERLALVGEPWCGSHRGRRRLAVPDRREQQQHRGQRSRGGRHPSRTEEQRVEDRRQEQQAELGERGEEVGHRPRRSRALDQLHAPPDEQATADRGAGEVDPAQAVGERQQGQQAERQRCGRGSPRRPPGRRPPPAASARRRARSRGAARSPGSRSAAGSRGTAPPPGSSGAGARPGSTAAAPASTAKLPARPPTTMLVQLRRFSQTV